MGTATRGAIMTAASVARSASRCPGPSVGPQPETGSSATSIDPASSAIAGWRSVSPAKYAEPPAPRTTNPTGSAAAPSGQRRASCVAGVAVTRTGSMTRSSRATTSLSSPVIRFFASQRAAPRGAITSGLLTRRSDRASAWSACRCERRTASIASSADEGTGGATRTSGPTWVRTTGSVSRRTPSSSMSTVECPSHVISSTGRASPAGAHVASSDPGDAVCGAPSYGRGAVTVPDAPTQVEPAQEEQDGRGHVRRALGGTKELARIAYRDPAHISERLTLHATQNLAESSRQWAEHALRDRPDATPAEIADELRDQSVKIARIAGAVAGTPFFIALVPGYLSYLWQEARMGLRTAALFGHDPGTMRTAAEMLTLRGVHPTVQDAEAALRDVESAPPPVAERRSLRTWFNSVRYVLIFGGFLAAPTKKVRPGGAREYLRLGAGAVFAFAIWVATWVLPVTFM